MSKLKLWKRQSKLPSHRVERLVIMHPRNLFLNAFFIKLLQEYGLDFRYLLDELLVEKPKEPIKVSASFSFSEHRLSKEITSASFSKQVEQERQQPSPPPTLPPAPPMPTLSAAPPPINRRRTPAPINPNPPPSSAPPPIGDSDSLYPPLPMSAITQSSNLKSPNNLMSPSSAYSNAGRFEISNSTTAPLFSTRQNATNYPLSAMARARTPVSSVQQLQQATTPLTAPIPNVPLASPLPRAPMSATPYRMRDRSDSIKDRDGSESYRERERPPRSARGSPVPRSPIPPPPRSSARPGSSMGQRTPVAVPQREGMI